MARLVITRDKAITDLRELFSISEGNVLNGYENNGNFGINKQFLERGEVMRKLQNYFVNKVFEKGLGLVVGDITVVYTTLEIKEINK